MAILTCRRKNSSLYVVFSEDTSIRYAARINSALSKIISEPVKTFRMDLSAVEDTDISFIQLLIAFSEKLKKQNRQMLIVNPSGAPRFLEAAGDCGLTVQSLFEIEE